MDVFEASNGVRVGIHGRELRVANPRPPYTATSVRLDEPQRVAVREFFAHELGVWVWPDNPEYKVIRLPASDDFDGRCVAVLAVVLGIILAVVL